MAANPRLSVTYLGHLDYSAIDELFRQSDIVALPSQWPEPLGAVAIEAMSAGAAVIASNIGGLDTALIDRHNGLLVDSPRPCPPGPRRSSHCCTAPNVRIFGIRAL